MTLRLTILCENTVARPFGLLGEHGFACYLETPQGKYWFDTGQGQTLIPNARRSVKTWRILKHCLSDTAIMTIPAACRRLWRLAMA